MGDFGLPQVQHYSKSNSNLNYCTQCGARLMQGDIYCSRCGSNIEAMKEGKKNVTVRKKQSFILNLAAFLCPVAGVLSYFGIRKEIPVKAKGMLIWAIVGLIFWIVISVVLKKFIHL